MSFLGSLFDPVGALATGGNNNTFDSVFSPGDNLFGDQGLGFEPSWQTNFTDSYSTPAGNFADNVMNVNEDELKNLGNHFSKNPGQLFYSGADPASTSLWNKITNQNNTPFVNQYGGETNKDYQNSANRGINTEDGRYMGAIANMVAGSYAGGALGNLAGNAYGSATAGAGAEGSAGSSALDVQAELAGNASAGTGGSQAGYDAARIPGWVAGSGFGGASGGQAASGAARGGASGAANALNSGQNPFTGAFKGAAQGGVGSNLDYASGIGIEDPYAKSAINGGITGGLRSGMQDTSNTGYGALVGALGGLASRGASAIGNYFSQPTTGSDPNSSTGTTNWGNLVTGLGQMYMSSRNNAGIQGQINHLNDLYAPNSPYAQQMQQALDRQDAAGGRRSQYGTRAVQLQAALANAASRNAPTLSNLYAQQRQNRFGQLAGMLAMGKNSGAFNGLSGMFGQQGQQPQFQPSQPMSQVGPGDMSQINPVDMNQDYSSILPGQIDPNQIYGG